MIMDAIAGMHVVLSGAVALDATQRCSWGVLFVINQAKRSPRGSRRDALLKWSSYAISDLRDALRKVLMEMCGQESEMKNTPLARTFPAK